MGVGVCKFCNLNARYARSHIIPKAFYVRSDLGPLHIFSNQLEHEPKRSPVGVYDSELICRACEATYEYLDSYAAEKLKPWPRRSQLFKDDIGLILKFPDGRLGGYWLTKVDANRMKLFFCFLTLRCAKTTREEYRITIPSEISRRLEEALRLQDASIADIHVLGSRFFDRKYVGTFSPWPRSPTASKPLNFAMLGLRFLVHFQTPDELPELCLGSGPNWPIIFDEFRGSNLHRIAVNMVSKFPSPWAGLRTHGRDGQKSERIIWCN